MKSLPLYLCYAGFAFLLIKAYFHLRYDRQRRKTGSLFLRWTFGVYALSIMFPIISLPNTDKEQRLKRIANIALVICYVFFVLTFIMVYAIYGG
jgi:hypothetical protein